MPKQRRRRQAVGRGPRSVRRALRAARGGSGTAARTSSAAPAVVRIRMRAGGDVFVEQVRRDAPIERIAAEWTYILRSRTRWVDDGAIRHAFRDRALADLERLGVGRAFVEGMTACKHIEVELVDWDRGDETANRVHEAAAELPWEYLLSAATRAVGRFQSILITRLVDNHKPARVPPQPASVLFIESAPGRLEDLYDFELEQKRIRSAAGADPASPDTPAARTWKVAATQSVSQLKKTVREGRWDAIHVTGLDTHQAGWEIDDFYDPDRTPAAWKKIFDASGNVRDGMVLREPPLTELPVPYDDLAAAIVDPRHPPSLVTLNLYYSGARIARELVRQGAHAALGFLDEIDDELAERFFQAFYLAWCRPDPDQTIPKAFIEAWQKMSGDGLHGTAIVIWMGHSVFDELPAGAAAAAAAAGAAEPDRQTILARQQLMPIGELLQVDLEVDEEVNYSLLHNDRPLLAKLTLTKLVKERLEDIGVVVELNLGAQNYPFRFTQLALSEPQLALASMVKIPLTAALPRSLRERVQSTVYVKVTCGGRIAAEATRRVTLIPVDEWLDDTDNNPWLPSFVLPRDPAIAAIIASSRRYLVGIADDPAAGFDGYQSVDEDAADPSAGVDAQVRAIWTALVNEYRLQYINPPPAYSERTQRLRTPSDILASTSGTCIDLALLLASCLEYVDIYPVVVLLTGHAFVGYWRAEDPHEEFVRLLRVPAEVPAVGSRTARSAAARLVDPYGWRLTRQHYDEIMEYVTSGDLVLLEATYLTSASSFAEAVEEGRANLRSRREFDSLLDIRLARSAAPPVTPLPIIPD
jgi:hypothetical protein